MTISYPYEENLYVNLTNRCNCHCTFCLRDDKGSIYTENSLWLEREPTVEEVVENITNSLEKSHKQLVFCGFGEPTYRIEDICTIIDTLKQKMEIPPVRINTNGHGSLIHGRDITNSFNGRVSHLSISLNAPDKEGYTAVTRPSQGEVAFEEMLDFAKKASQVEGVSVVFTVVDLGEQEVIEKSRKLADSLNIPLKVRSFIEK